MMGYLLRAALSIPVIAMAGIYKGLGLYKSEEFVLWGLLLIGVFVSSIIAYIPIAWFLKLLEKLESCLLFYTALY
jgi:undecaprenyl-diphosphatase